MALKRNERYPGRYSNPTTDHPQGAFKNRTAPSAQDGSYLEQDWTNDWDGFFGRLLTVAGITPNGNVDTALSSQYYDALKSLFLQRTNPFADIKADGPEAIATALSNLGLGGVTSLRSATFTSSTLWTAPAGVTEIELDGAGAGGGGGTGGPAAIGGGGGGAGETVVGRKITVVPGTTYTITIGLGGDGGTSVTSNGGDGGTTSFGTLLSLAGGKGGLKTGAAGVAGGTGGNDGLPGTLNATPALSFGGAGGSGLLGAGGDAALLSSVGGNAGEFGGGGGGGAGNKSGGHGANGIIRIGW